MEKPNIPEPHVIITKDDIAHARENAALHGFTPDEAEQFLRNAAANFGNKKLHNDTEKKKPKLHVRTLEAFNQIEAGNGARMRFRQEPPDGVVKPKE